MFKKFKQIEVPLLFLIIASFAYETYDFVENSNLLSSALSSFGVL